MLTATIARQYMPILPQAARTGEPCFYFFAGAARRRCLATPRKFFPNRYLAAATLLLVALPAPALPAPAAGETIGPAAAEERCWPSPRRPAVAERSAESAARGVARRLAALGVAEKARLYLPRHLGMLRFAAGELAFDPERQVARFLRDPALARLGELASQWVAEVAGPFDSMEQQIEVEVMVTRNLHRAGLTASPAAVRRIWEEILASRAELADLELWHGREVVFAVGRDNLQGGPTFGKNATIAALDSQQPATLEVIRATDREARAQLAAAIAGKENLTLLFETHGRPHELRWAGALGVSELAAMFARRRVASRAILILGACYAHDFGRAVVERLLQEGIAPPLLIVPEEYGQATLIGRQESALNRQLGLGGRGDTPARLGDLLGGRQRESAVYTLTERGLRQIR